MERRRVKQCVYSCPDLFNKLSDDIITDGILPLLDLKERMRTSMLSRRWRNLSRYTRTLVFPHGLKAWGNSSLNEPFLHLGCHLKCNHLATNREKYINWVTSTLRSFAGPQLDCFTVCYDLDSSFSQIVDFWLLRAIRLRVKKLHLHFGHFQGQQRNPDKNYTFPCANKLSSFLCLDLNAFPPSPPLGISYLKDISLEFVNVASQTVEYLLSSCPLLESISLKKASSIRCLRIAGPSLKLKYLHVLGCLTLEKLDIAAPNLITLEYDGPHEALFFTSIPRLEHLHASGNYFKHFFGFLSRGSQLHFGYYSCQLKILEFDMIPAVVDTSQHFSLELPMLFKLEEVRVKMHSTIWMVLLWPCCLLKSAPRLKRFVVEHRRAPAVVGISHHYREGFERNTVIMKEATKCKHPCLKVIEFVGVHWALNHNQLACQLVSCAASLEKVVFDTLGKPDEFKEYSNNFRRRMPSDAQMVLL